ncbi:hypothetical protein GCM10027429_17080 [Marivirga atlantica]
MKKAPLNLFDPVATFLEFPLATPIKDEILNIRNRIANKRTTPKPIAKLNI